MLKEISHIRRTAMARLYFLPARWITCAMPGTVGKGTVGCEEAVIAARTHQPEYRGRVQ